MTENNYPEVLRYSDDWIIADVYENKVIATTQDDFGYLDTDAITINTYEKLNRLRSRVLNNTIELTDFNKSEMIRRLDNIIEYVKCNDIFNLSTRVVEAVKTGKGDYMEVPYRNEVVFAITDTGYIKVISYECNEPSFLGDEEIQGNEEMQILDEPMWNKVYKSSFFMEGGIDNAMWTISTDEPDCKLVFDLNSLDIE